MYVNIIILTFVGNAKDWGKAIMDLAVLKHKVFYGVECNLTSESSGKQSLYFQIIAKIIFSMGIKIILMLQILQN